MKTTLFGFLGCLLLVGATSHLQGQIRDDDASMSYLAHRCAMSAGSSASNYAEYGAKLARTIGDLDIVQQQRVFGYVPRPFGGSGGSPTEASGPLLKLQTPETLADSLLAAEVNAGTLQATTGSADETTPLLQVNLDVQADTESGTADLSAAVQSPLNQSGVSLSTSTSSLTAETELESQVEGAGAQADAGPGNADGVMPRGYERLPEWLTNVIEQFESRYFQ